MDPISITTLVVTACGLLLGIFQSVRMNHFESECFGKDSCFSVKNHFEGKNKDSDS